MASKTCPEEETIEFAWWIEMVTTLPTCTYYFGPFTDFQEAQLAQRGYLEDLNQEGAQVIEFQIQQCQPQKLTISEMN